ncbi:unnamed protein product [Trifolium pratense]|uniref:Uncharacterized protein n=1 Tax=Trifolium pratense TaxID=57577 RepID=A0ACB0LB61_TRIPR|nr:unnamed protein product [Trifolium pratense]
MDAHKVKGSSEISSSRAEAYRRLFLKRIPKAWWMQLIIYAVVVQNLVLLFAIIIIISCCVIQTSRLSLSSGKRI